jgi:hypothetical protein
VIIEGERINPCQAGSINKSAGEVLEELLILVNNTRSKIREREDAATLNTIDQSTDRTTKETLQEYSKDMYNLYQETSRRWHKNLKKNPDEP